MYSGVCASKSFFKGAGWSAALYELSFFGNWARLQSSPKAATGRALFPKKGPVEGALDVVL